MKKVLAIMLCAVILFSLAGCLSNKPLLSEMDKTEFIKTLKRYGVQVSDNRLNDIRGWVVLFEKDIDSRYPSDVYFDETHMLFESVRSAVQKYYGSRITEINRSSQN